MKLKKGMKFKTDSMWSHVFDGATIEILAVNSRGWCGKYVVVPNAKNKVNELVFSTNDPVLPLQWINKIIDNGINPNFKSYVKQEKHILNFINFPLSKGDIVKSKIGKAIYELIEIGAETSKCKMLVTSRGKPWEYQKGHSLTTLKTSNLIKTQIGV